MADAKPKKKREGGPSKVDNGFKLTKFKPMPSINQKNYYTLYLKRDNQLLVNRNADGEPGSTAQATKRESTPRETPARDEDETEDETVAGARTVVLHLGSRTIRAGFASDLTPKKIPACIARRIPEGGPPPGFQNRPETGLNALLDGSEDFDEAYAAVRNDFRERMRYYKRRIVSSGEETVRSFNARQTGEKIEVNDDDSDEEDAKQSPKDTVLGAASLKQGDGYTLSWPFAFSAFNEGAYPTPQSLLGDVSLLLRHTVHAELGLVPAALANHSVVFIIPDLYERSYVIEVIELLLKDLGFGKVAVIQESVVATFGAGISSACVIDVGAQTTKIACVDEGMVVPSSRVMLKFGGDDITVAFMAMLERSNFPYSDIDLTRAYDWTLANHLKATFATTNEDQIAVQLYSFQVRVPGKPALKYDIKVYEEVMLPILGLFYPSLFAPAVKKLTDKYKLFPRSVNIYDWKYNDPVSDAMLDISLGTLAVDGKDFETKLRAEAAELAEKALAEAAEQAAEEAARKAAEAEAKAAAAAAAEAEAEADADAVKPEEKDKSADKPDGKRSDEKDDKSDDDVDMDGDDADDQDEDGEDDEKPGKSAAAAATATEQADELKAQLAKLVLRAKSVNPRDIPDIAMDHAIVESIAQAERAGVGSVENYYGNLLLVGGGANFAGFHQLLTDRLGMWTQSRGQDIGEISLLATPRDMDPDELVWKGGCVYAKLRLIDELWISPNEWEILGSRVLQYKALFLF